MMRKGSRRAVVIVSLALATCALGCELALDFDRTKIDGGGIDASFGDTALPDQVAADVAPQETGSDAPADSPVVDTGTDAGSDTGGGNDTGTDAPVDADDAG